MGPDPRFFEHLITGQYVARASVDQQDEREVALTFDVDLQAMDALDPDLSSQRGVGVDKNVAAVDFLNGGYGTLPYANWHNLITKLECPKPLDAQSADH